MPNHESLRQSSRNSWAQPWSAWSPALGRNPVGGVEHLLLLRLAALPSLLPACFAPLAFVLTWLAMRYMTRVERPWTSELYITTYHAPGGRVPLAQLPGRILATTATVGLGGSQGFESTSALIGAAWSDLLARSAVFTVSEETRRSLLTAGASAGIAAVFSSPAAGASTGSRCPLSTMSTPRAAPRSRGGLFLSDPRLAHRRGSNRQRGRYAAFELGVLPRLPAGRRGMRPGNATLCPCRGGVAVPGTQAIRVAPGTDPRRIARIAGRVGLLVVRRVITFGSGYVAAGWILAEPRPLRLLGLLFLIRAGGNLISIYAGGGGGVFTSLACNGAFIGEAVARGLGCDTTHTLALLGAAGFLGSGYRLPLACMLFVAEGSLVCPPPQQVLWQSR